MATSFVQPILQVFDDYGAILAGGKIYTYEAGTTTPLATYTDLAGSSANTNPVILDSAGRADIRATDGVAYKFAIYDSDDNLIDTLDNITVGASSASSSTSYIIPFTYTGTPGAQAFMGGHIFDDDVTLPVDLEGAVGYVETNPASNFAISLRKNGSEVATATISSTGAYTFATTGSTTVSFSSGDRLTFIGPDGVGSAADFTITIAGTLA